MLEIAKAFFALLFVLGLILGVGVLLRSWHHGRPRGRLLNRFFKKNTSVKFSETFEIIEVKALDTRRRLVLVANGKRRYVLLLSPQGEMLIEQYTVEAVDSFSETLQKTEKKHEKT